MYRSALLFLVLPALSIASGPLDCVDPEFVRAFFSWRSSTPPAYSTEIPDHFEVQKFPSDMKLVGSRTENSMTTVIFRTNREARDAFSGLAGALSEQGWKDITYQRAPSRRGFQLAIGSVVAEFCREMDDTNLAVIASERSGQTLISLEQYGLKTMHGCEGTLRRSPKTLLKRLPILNPPDNAKTFNAGIGTDGHEVSTRVDVSVSMSREELLVFFEDQIRNQNWKFLTEWSSDLSSGSVWTRNTSEEGILIGTLHAYDAGTDPVRVRFSIDPADPAKGIDHGMSSSSSSGCN